MNKIHPSLKRRKFIKAGCAMLAMAMAGRGAAAEGEDEAVDITFYHLGDPQYRALDTTEENGVSINQAIRNNLKLMIDIQAGGEMPGGLGSVGEARGVINVGDCIYSANEGGMGPEPSRIKQWDNYVADFGLTGIEGKIGIPVYEGFGNRDQDGFVQQVIERISERNKQRPGVVAVSPKYAYPAVKGGFSGVVADGLHYAWKWGPVHFIQGNLRVGDSHQRFPSVGSHSFLADYLDKHVGFSGAPVIIAMHLPPTTAQEGEWPLEDRQKFYDLILGYNVVAIFCGNTSSFKSGEWRGPGGDGSRGIRFYQCDAFHRSGAGDGLMNVVRIKSDPADPSKAQMVVARRMRNNSWGSTEVSEISLKA